MPVDTDAYELVKEVGTWILLAEPSSIKDDRGNRTYLPDVKYRAFIQYAEREFRGGTAESRVARAMIMMLPVIINSDGTDTYVSVMPNITPEYKITLMDGSRPPITNVDNAIGDGELDHLVIFT